MSDDFMKRIAPPKPTDPRTLPEYAWTMVKNRRRLTLRWRLIPLGDQQRVDLRFYSNDRLLKSYVILDGRSLDHACADERRERLEDGWQDVTSIEGSH